jgi:thymidylate kinase
MSGRLVALEGPSGAGKSRAVGEVANRGDVTGLPEAYDRIRPRPALSWSSDEELLRLELRLLREDARRYREARALVRRGKIVLADTGFLGPLTYTAGLVRRGLAGPRVLRALVETAGRWADAGRWGLPDAILYLRTSPSDRRRRALADARGHPPSEQARHQQIAAEESRFYRTVVRPLYGPRFRVVSGEGPPDLVAARVGRALARTRPRARLPSPKRVLRGLDPREGVS